MDRIPLAAVALVCAGCVAPQVPPPPQSDGVLLSRVRDLTAAVGRLERQVAELTAPPPAPAAEIAPVPVADPRAGPSRFAVLRPGTIPLAPEDRAEFAGLAHELQLLSPERGAGRVVDFGKTRPGLKRAILALHLVGPAQRAAILHYLRTTEVRAILEQEVVQQDAPAPTPAPAATVPPSPPAPTTAGRYRLAGHGAGAWQTVLDTHTGVVYNLRSVGGTPRWVAITPALRSEQAACPPPSPSAQPSTAPR